MVLTNDEIYFYANKLMEVFSDKDQKLPIKINFYLQKNKKVLLELAQNIEQSRIDIIKSYGQEVEDGQYSVAADKIEIVNNELSDLLSLTQEVQIYKVNIDTLDGNLMLTTDQMEALMFMIEE